MTPPTIWLRCSRCRFVQKCGPKRIELTPHPDEHGRNMCTKTRFVILTDLDEKTQHIYASERERRTKLYAMNHAKGGAARRGVKGTSRWEGVRSASARPSKGSAGAPGLGKR